MCMRICFGQKLFIISYVLCGALLGVSRPPHHVWHKGCLLAIKVEVVWVVYIYGIGGFFFGCSVNCQCACQRSCCWRFQSVLLLFVWLFFVWSNLFGVLVLLLLFHQVMMFQGWVSNVFVWMMSLLGLHSWWDSKVCNSQWGFYESIVFRLDVVEATIICQVFVLCMSYC